MRKLIGLACAAAVVFGIVGCSGSDDSARREQAEQTMQEIMALLEDHEAVGTEDEVAGMIAAHATEDAVMDDVVFGPYPYRQGFYNTLYFADAEARLEVYEWWLADDGSSGGFLWMWYGTNVMGNPFELAGVSLTEFDEEGRVSYEKVVYPYPGEYVTEGWMWSGTPVPSTG